MQKSKAIFSWSVTGLLTVLMVASVGAMTIKSAPSSSAGNTQTSLSSSAPTSAPVLSPSANPISAHATSDDGATTTTTSSEPTSTVPVGSVPAPTSVGDNAGEGKDENEFHPVGTDEDSQPTSGTFNAEDGSDDN